MLIDWQRYSPRITMAGHSTGGLAPYSRLRWREPVAHHDLWYTIRGTGEMKAKHGATIPLKTGTSLWLTPGHVYEVYQDPEDPIVNYYVHFELVDRSGVMRPYDEPTPPELLENADSMLLDPILRRIYELLPFYSRDVSPHFPPEHLEIAQSLLRGLLINLDYTTDSDAGGINGTRRYRREVILRSITRMQEQTGGEMTIESLAEDAGYSSEHFSRIFREIMGQSPVDYLIRVRMERARKLLLDSSLSIDEISRMLGYRYQAFFSSQFRRRTGLTPREYRRRYRQNSGTAKADDKDAT